MAAVWPCERQKECPAPRRLWKLAARRVQPCVVCGSLLTAILPSSAPGDREAEEREAHMGAKAAVGRHEVCLRGPSLPPLDEPLCWLPIQAAADEDPERRPRVLCVSLQGRKCLQTSELSGLRAQQPHGPMELAADGAMGSLMDLGHRHLSLLVCTARRSMWSREAILSPS